MGGRTSEKLDTLAVEIWTWCLNIDIFLKAQDTPGKSNLQADKLSRNFSNNYEWKLSEPFFSRICSKLIIPNVDLFASRSIAQIDKFENPLTIKLVSVLLKKWTVWCHEQYTSIF